MAKSTGNFLTVQSEFLDKNIDPLVYRYACFVVHYRKQMEWNDDVVTSATNGYHNLLNKVKILGEKVGSVNLELKDRFLDGINDDLNMPKAMATVNEIFKYGISNEDKLATILDFDKVLGFNLAKKEIEIIPDAVIQLSKEREEARLNKDWAKSDEIRDQIQNLGYEIKDTDSGTLILKI